VLWVVVALLVLALDQLSKWWAQHHLTVGVPRNVLGSFLRLDLTHNAGAAFSVGTGYTVVLSLLALVVIVIGVRTARRLGSTGWSLALGLLLGGALGNVTDRMFRAPGPLRGHVVDFLRLPHWAIFNLADASICAAAALFVLLTRRGVALDGSRHAEPAGRDQTTSEP
jgi:signal peptidase II